MQDTTTHPDPPCLSCNGTGMRAVDANFSRTCRRCWGTGCARSFTDLGNPHAIDHMGYADGTPKPEAMLVLEQRDPFWQTLGGSDQDPWGDGGETLRQRRRAMALGIGHNIYPCMGTARESEQP